MSRPPHAVTSLPSCATSPPTGSARSGCDGPARRCWSTSTCALPSDGALSAPASTVSDMADIGTDWRVRDGVATAWFDASSLTEGASLARRVIELSAEILVDLRATGVRVRLDDVEHAESVSAAARELGLTADPAALQQLSVVLESPDPSAVRPFWQS